MKKLLCYFTKGEMVLWSVSVIFAATSFFIFDRENYLMLSASVIGITSLVFNAKGNPLGPFFMVIFSLLYGIISFTFSYYGEMLTYLGMTAPMAVFSFISWIKNPYNGNKKEVAVNHIGRKECCIMVLLTLIVTWIFYFILDYFDTANIIPSTISVTTSFLAVYLTFRRSAFYAAAYAVNDIVLIVLWSLAAMADISYVSVIVCFITFLINDIYGFISWSRMEKCQNITS